jgi:hypothetical protein
MTKEEAVARGAKTFLGAPCRHGHPGERYASNGLCVECQRAANAAYRVANREKVRAWDAAWRAANREKVRARIAAWRAENPEKERARMAAWRAANPEKVRARKARKAAWRAANRKKERARKAAYRTANREKVRAASAAYRTANHEKERARNAAWATANPEKARAKGHRRRALKLEQLCDCCTPEQFEAFEATRPPGCDLEHVVPLKLSALLGLKGAHCIKNFQWLPVALHKEKTRLDKQLLALVGRALKRGERLNGAPLDEAIRIAWRERGKVDGPVGRDFLER